MANLSVPQLIIVLVIIMLVFGVGKLPQIGDGLGKAIRNLKRGLSEEDPASTNKRFSQETRAKEADIAE